MDAERRASIASYPVGRHRTRTGPSRTRREARASIRWYGPWLALAFVLVGLIFAAITMLAIVTAPHQQPAIPSGRHAEEPLSEVGVISADR